MLGTLRNALLAAASLAGASALYLWSIAGQERYTLFDLVQGRPAVIGQAAALAGEEAPFPGDAVPEAAPAEDAGTAIPGVALDPDSASLLQRFNDALADLAAAVVPSVVSIDTTTTVNVPRYEPVDPFGFFGYRQSNQRYQAPGLGSGVVVSEEGHILTNHHVVAGVDAIRVTLHDGEHHEAEWVGSDPAADVAVLKVIVPENDANPPVFRPLPFGDSDAVRVGDMALAIGNPFGLSESVTRGIISAKQRRLSDGASEYFQTDAVINPGNSGGPLVDVQGRIIGINTAIFTGQQDLRVWQGIGLAIPANEAREVFEAVAFGKPLIRGYLGLGLTDLNAALARAFRLRSVRGALVTDVDEGSPAAAAGILPGDLILSFDGAEVKSAEDALQRIRRKRSGASVDLALARKGEPLQMQLMVAERPDSTALRLRSDITASGQSMAEALGLAVRDLTPAERQNFGLRPEDPAILVADVGEGSQAASRSLLPGDLIHAINQDRVNSTAEFYDLLGSLPKNRQSVIIMTRQGRRFDVYLNPGA